MDTPSVDVDSPPRLAIASTRDPSPADDSQMFCSCIIQRLLSKWWSTTQPPNRLHVPPPRVFLRSPEAAVSPLIHVLAPGRRSYHSRSPELRSGNHADQSPHYVSPVLHPTKVSREPQAPGLGGAAYAAAHDLLQCVGATRHGGHDGVCIEVSISLSDVNIGG